MNPESKNYFYRKQHTKESEGGKMNIEELKISEIQIDKDNPREATPEQIEIYKNIFKRFGMAVPIIIDSENKVFDENGKLEAARELNFEIVKVVRLEKLSESIYI